MHGKSEPKHCRAALQLAPLCSMLTIKEINVIGHKMDLNFLNANRFDCVHVQTHVTLDLRRKPWPRRNYYFTNIAADMSCSFQRPTGPTLVAASSSHRCVLRPRDRLSPINSPSRGNKSPTSGRRGDITVGQYFYHDTMATITFVVSLTSLNAISWLVVT